MTINERIALTIGQLAIAVAEREAALEEAQAEIQRLLSSITAEAVTVAAKH